MEIYCQNCRKRVGQVADEKIPVGQKASVKCPQCGERIVLSRPAAAFDPEATVLEEAAASAEQIRPYISSGAEQAGGSGAVTSPVAAGGDFAIGAILSEAWQKTSGVKGPIWGGIGMIFLVVFALGFGVRMLAAIFGGEGDNFALETALQITINVAIYPCMAGVMMIGIRHSVGLPVNWQMAFGYFSYLLPIIIAAVLITVLTFVGILLLLLPGIYLSIAYALTIPLIVDKGLGPWQAMEASRQAIHRCWFKVFGLFFLMMLICLASLIPLGLGLIWTLPMFGMANAILYRELFGVSEKA